MRRMPSSGRLFDTLILPGPWTTASRLAQVAHVCPAAVCVQLGKVQDAGASLRHAQALGTRWTIRALKAADFAGIGVGAYYLRMNALWDDLRLAGLPE